MKAPITSTVLFLSAGALLAGASPLENRDLFDSATSAVGGAFSTATSGAAGVVNTATSDAVGAVTTATSAVGGGFSTVTSFGGGVASAVTSAGGSEVTAVGSATAVSAGSGVYGGMNWVGLCVGVTVGVLGGLGVVMS
jgi:hypothetical protein